MLIQDVFNSSDRKSLPSLRKIYKGAYGIDLIDIKFPQCIIVSYRPNKIFLRDSILIHVKHVKRLVNEHLLNDVSSPVYYQNALRRM